MNLFRKRTQDPSNTAPDTPAAADTPQEHPLIEIIRFSFIALLIVIPVRMFIAQPFIVSGPSMESTFHQGEYLIVDQLSFYLRDPERGEVVVFRYPVDPSKFFIKRIIGVPGDTISVENDVVTVTNEVYPEGIVLDEPYVDSMTINQNVTEELGAGEYFVMGDNRDKSSDSRYWGVLQKERVVGRALFRLFPPQEINYLPGSFSEIEDVISATPPQT